MCGSVSIQFRISDCNDCLIGDFRDSRTAGQNKRPVLLPSQTWQPSAPLRAYEWPTIKQQEQCGGQYPSARAQLYQVVLWQGSLSVPAHFVGGVDLVSLAEPLGRQGSGGYQ